MIVEGIKSLWAFFCPPDPKVSDLMGPEASMSKVEDALKNGYWWRVKVSLTLIGLFILAMAALFSPWGFVTASDLKQVVDAKVEESMKTMKAEQQQIKADVAELKATQIQQTFVLNEILKTSIATNICRLLARRQRESNEAERVALRTDIDTEQGKYKAVAAEYYPESRCGGGL